MDVKGDGQDKQNVFFILYFVLCILYYVFCFQYISYIKLFSENLMDNGIVIFNMNKLKSKNVEFVMFFCRDGI